MKKFYIYIQELEGFSKAEDYAIFAKDKEDAVNKYIHSCTLGLTSNSFTHEDKWRLFAKESPNYVEEHHEWEEMMKDYEITDCRPIEV